MTGKPYTGPERRTIPSALEIAARAAEIAAQRVAHIQRRRSFIVGMFASLIIAIPIIIIDGRLRAIDQHHVNVYNCHTALRRLHVLGAFIRSDAIDRKGQLTATEKATVLQDFGKIVEPKLLKRLSTSQQALDDQTIMYWYQLLGKLAALDNCSLIR